jgi:hypothetical protein
MKKSPGFGNREAYNYWVLRALSEADNGTMAKREACQWIFPRIRDQLITHDFEPVGSDVHRWENQIAWARKDLVSKGFLESGTPTDVWVISSSGRDLLKRFSSPPKLNRQIEEIG